MQKMSKGRQKALALLIGVFGTGAAVGALAASVIGAAMDKPEQVPVFIEKPVPVVLTITEEAQAPETKAAYTPDPEEVELIGRTIWGEAGGVKSKAERAAVAWCILNRADAWGKSIEDVVTAPHQFHGYRTWGECPQEHLDLAADVLTRWNAEKEGDTNAGRTLPADYLYFYGDGERNHFSIEWRSGVYWDWSLDNPYNTKEANA